MLDDLTILIATKIYMHIFFLVNNVGFQNHNTDANTLMTILIHHYYMNKLLFNVPFNSDCGGR